MKLKISDKLKSAPSTIIIPLQKGIGLKKALTRLSSVFGIEKSFIRKNFKAEACEIASFHVSKSKTLRLLGLGETPDYAETRNAFRTLSFNLKLKLTKNVCIDLKSGNLSQNRKDLAKLAEASVAGLVLGTYIIGKFKAEYKNTHPIAREDAFITLIVRKNATSRCRAAAKKGKHLAATMMHIFDLVNAPGNKLTPEDFAFEARESGKKFGFKVTVFNKVQIKKAGLHALLAVNKGSESPPVFIIMEYRPAGKNRKKPKKIGLVGKGVTFDTGGLSIKGSNNMHYMKSDMGGAAAVLGAIELTARLQLPVHLIGIIPATDNCVDARSVMPGDVINSYSGKTIEVIDTDAEGRLILADGLAYIHKNYNPEIIIDLATLTGSSVQTLGYEAGALFTNNNEVAKRLIKAGNATSEKLWQLPLWDNYAPNIASDVADVKNFSGQPIAGAINAAKFLEAFTDGHEAWAHLDIAGVAFGDSPFSKSKSATGFGINLLVDFLRKI